MTLLGLERAHVSGREFRLSEVHAGEEIGKGTIGRNGAVIHAHATG